MSDTVERSIWEKLTAYKVKYSLLILLLISLGTVFFIYQCVVNLKIYTNFFELYPPNHPYIQLYKEYRKMFGTANVLSMVVEVKNGDIYNLETIQKIDRLTKAMMKVKGVNPNQIISITHPKLKSITTGAWGIKVVPLTFPRLPKTEEELRLLKEKIYINEGIRGIYVTPDDRATLINAGFWEEGVDLENLYQDMMQLKKQEEDESHEIFITGYPMLYAWIAHYATQLYGVFILTGAVLFLLLLFYFRSMVGVVVPMVSGILSAIWGLGFAAFMGYNIDPLILVVPMLLSARALSHSVQCLERYYEDFDKYKDKTKAIIKSYSHLYKPAILSIATDGLGVLTIAVCTIPIMQKLAFFSSFWIISIFLSVVTLNPIMLKYMPAPKKNPQKEGIEADELIDGDELPQRKQRIGDRIYLKICQGFIYLTYSWRRRVVVVVLVLILIVGGYFSSLLKVGDTSAGKAVLYDNHPYNVAARKLNSEFSGASRLVVIAKGKQEGAMQQAESLRSIEDMEIFAECLPNVGGTLTITDVVKRLYRMYHEGFPKWSMLPENKDHLYQTFFLLGSSMAPGELDQFISTPKYTNATVTLFFREYNNQIIKDAIAGLKKYANENPLEEMRFRLAGGILGILAAVNEEVEWSYWVNMALIFSMTYLLCTITYRSLLCATVLIVPLVVSQLLSDNFMLMLGIDLNINSLPIAAIGVGVGVDYGIYILSRLSEEYQANKSLSMAITTTITTTGKAVSFTASTLFAGVVFWMFSVMKFQAEMGFLLGFLMIMNMIGSIIFIPVLVTVFGAERTLLKYKV